MIKYSVIIPHFNSFDLLEKLIKSIPIRSDVEVIVVDDKSNFKGYELFFEKNKKNNIFFLKNTNKIKGAGVCRNIGVEKSKGKWLLFADSDDFFLENAFNIIDKELEKQSNSVEILFFEPTSLELDTGKKSDRHKKLKMLIDNFLKNKTLKSESCLRYSSNTPWSKVIKKQLVMINNIKFDKTIIANDSMFSAKVGRHANKIGATNEKIYCVTKSKGSLTTIKEEAKYDVRIDVFIRYYNLFNEKELRDIELSAVPLLFNGRIYGFKKIISTIFFLKRNKIKIFKYFKIDFVKIQRLFYEVSYGEKYLKK